MALNDESRDGGSHYWCTSIENQAEKWSKFGGDGSRVWKRKKIKIQHKFILNLTFMSDRISKFGNYSEKYNLYGKFWVISLGWNSLKFKSVIYLFCCSSSSKLQFSFRNVVWTFRSSFICSNYQNDHLLSSKWPLF